MLSKLKDKLNNLNVDEQKEIKQRKIDISFLNEDQIKLFNELIT